MIEVASPQVLHPDGALSPGWVQVEGERIVRTGRGTPPAESASGSAGQVSVLSPGFVDIHGHGGGGFSYDDVDPDHVRHALAAHRRHGTTTTVASLVTSSPQMLQAQVVALTEFVRTGELAGVHLEGPCLSPSYKGAHAERWLIEPDHVDLLALADPRVVVMVTLAPELPGALAMVPLLTSAGVTVAIGHTAADADIARRAIEAGATVVTHLFNAMPSIHHRAPGPVPVALTDPRVFVELVADGHHVAEEVLRMASATAGNRTLLITDAMAGAAAPDGEYPLGELTATVKGGLARIGPDGPIAGSTLTMDRAVRVMVAAGVDLGAALFAASTAPAQALGMDDVGRLESGCFADLVILDPDLKVAKVMRRGQWLP